MTTSIGVGSSAILVLEDSQEGGRGGDGRKAVGGVVAPRSLATFRLRLRPSDEDDDERTANTEEEAGGGIGKVERCRRRTKEKRRRKRRRQRGGGERERGDYLKLAESLVRQQS